MKNTATTTYPLNLHPNALAAALSEQDVFAKIDVLPDESPHAGQWNEITKTAVSKKNNELTISTKSQSDERRELLGELDGRSPFNGLLRNMETVANQFKTDLFLEERKNTLGSSDLHTHFFGLPAFLTPEQQKAMTYFLPWMSQIKGDVALMERCFFTILHFPVKIKAITPKPLIVKGMNVSNWITDHTDAVGGTSVKKGPCHQIEIGPVPMDDLHLFVPGSQQRRFMEDVLFPHFFPKEWDWQTVVVVEKGNENFTVPITNGLSVVGINSYVAT